MKRLMTCLAAGLICCTSILAAEPKPKDAAQAGDQLYNEIYRPQFHFTPKKNWTNDPNGLVYYDGEYHLFFQHNPHGINWGNMTWGHAVSPDLLHWKQLDHAIHPDKLGTIFSGSAVVDTNNTAGFQTGDEKVIVCIYTSAGKPFTQSIAYSNDRGRSWTKYEKNPVLGHIAGHNRDPKVIWYEPIKKWVMALFLDRGQYALFTSPNLKQWERLCDIPPSGGSECPDFFDLPVDGDAKNKKWIFWAGNGNYLVGTFDGKKFTKEGGPFRFEYGHNYYAAQSYSDIPESDGRRIQIGWMRGGKYPGMPFNQQMSFPRVLTLRSTAEGPRMYCRPVKEIEKIRVKEHSWSDCALKPGQNLLKDLSGDLFEIQLEIAPGKAETFGFTLRGAKVEYSVADKRLNSLGRSVELAPQNGKIKLHVLLDRTCVETFGNDGKVVISSCFLPKADDRSLGIFATGGEAQILSLKVYELRSAWEQK